MVCLPRSWPSVVDDTREGRWKRASELTCQPIGTLQLCCDSCQSVGRGGCLRGVVRRGPAGCMIWGGRARFNKKERGMRGNQGRDGARAWAGRGCGAVVQLSARGSSVLRTLTASLRRCDLMRRAARRAPGRLISKRILSWSVTRLMMPPDSRNRVESATVRIL